MDNARELAYMQTIDTLTKEVEHQKERKVSIGAELDKWRNRAVAHQADNQRLREQLRISPRVDFVALEKDLMEGFNVIGGRLPKTEELMDRERLLEFVRLTRKYIIKEGEGE